MRCIKSTIERYANLFFVIVCLIIGSLYYSNYVQELRETIKYQDRVIYIQKCEIDLFYRIYLPMYPRSDDMEDNPLYQ